MADEFGNKTGGRQKGTLNKRTERAIEFSEQSELDPLEFDFAILNWDLEKLGISEENEKEIDIRTQLEMRQKASDSLKPHLYPKLKATEIKLDDEVKGRVFTMAYSVGPKKEDGST